MSMFDKVTLKALWAIMSRKELVNLPLAESLRGRKLAVNLLFFCEIIAQKAFKVILSEIYIYIY